MGPLFLNNIRVFLERVHIVKMRNDTPYHNGHKKESPKETLI